MENTPNNENQDYIGRLTEILSTTDNEELVTLVQRLINERNLLAELANVDALTGLNNRRALSKVKNVTGILMIDVDDFKSINDTFGHDVGDYVIKTVANIIKTSARSSDYICRYGGDEFVVAFIDCPQRVVKERAQRILQEVTDRLKLQDREITLSIGIAMNDNNEKILENLIKKADAAMYYSKKTGKNQVINFDEVNDSVEKHR